MRRHTQLGCAGAAALLAAALVAVRAPARRVQELGAEMGGRLRALAAAQARHRERTGRYAATLDDAGVTDSTGVRIAIEAASDSGWSATAAHPSTTVVCRVWVGRPRGPGREGEPRCE